MFGEREGDDRRKSDDDSEVSAASGCPPVC